VTTGTSGIWTFSLDADGRRIAALVYTAKGKLDRLDFDPSTATIVGSPAPILSTIAFTPGLSPDGEWIVYASEGREDLFVVRIDGTGTRRLTDDPARDRYPHWSPRGDRIVFMSNRSGSYQVWTIRPDGGGLRQETGFPKDLMATMWYPDGGRIACTDRAGSLYVLDMTSGAGGPRREDATKRLPLPDPEESSFIPMAWAPDGARIAGDVIDPEAGSKGIALFSFDSGACERVVRFDPPLGEFGFPSWLPDGRRFLFMRGAGLALFDLGTGKESKIELPGGDKPDSWYFLSGDGKTLLRAMGSTDQDIWLIDLGSDPRTPE